MYGQSLRLPSACVCIYIYIHTHTRDRCNDAYIYIYIWVITSVTVTRSTQQYTCTRLHASCCTLSNSYMSIAKYILSLTSKFTSKSSVHLAWIVQPVQWTFTWDIHWTSHPHWPGLSHCHVQSTCPYMWTSMGHLLDIPLLTTSTFLSNPPLWDVHGMLSCQMGI